MKTTGGLGAWPQSRPTPRPPQWAPGAGPCPPPWRARGGAAHPTRGDHGVLKHTAAELAAQLHRGLLGKHKRLLRPSRVGAGWGVEGGARALEGTPPLGEREGYGGAHAGRAPPACPRLLHGMEATGPHTATFATRRWSLGSPRGGSGENVPREPSLASGSPTRTSRDQAPPAPHCAHSTARVLRAPWPAHPPAPPPPRAVRTWSAGTCWTPSAGSGPRQPSRSGAEC